MRKQRRPRNGKLGRARSDAFDPRYLRRRLLAGSTVLLLVALALIACLAPIGQARPAREASPEATSLQATPFAATEARREEREAERKAKHEANWPTGGERTNVVVQTSCTQIVWQFRNFPDMAHNGIVLKLTINHTVTLSRYTFDGPESTLTMPIDAPPGRYKIDTRGLGKSNGARVAFDIGVPVNCRPAPAFALEKLQQIEGGGGSYTTAPLSGEVGKTIDYKILLSNTGNVPLSFAALEDPRCDAGTITGGPTGELAPGASVEYLCTHLITPADAEAGALTNTVTLTGAPPEGDGTPVEHSSNTVEVTPQAAAPPEPEPPTPVQPTPVVPTPGSSTPAAQGGVLASKSEQAPGTTGTSSVSSAKTAVVPTLKLTLPRLKGPQGCVRSSFHASVKSAHVASITFFMDGHKLKTLTARNARKGLLSITIDPTSLHVGPHKLSAKITMVKTSASAKALKGTRRRTVLRCDPAVVTPKFTG
jgi:hypothetical protein